MHICMLFEPGMPTVPEEITVVQDFGHETIVDSTGKVLARGNSMYLSGEESDFIKWLSPLDCIWQSSNPMCGNWEQTHIKQ